MNIANIPYGQSTAKLPVTKSLGVYFKMFLTNPRRLKLVWGSLGVYFKMFLTNPRRLKLVWGSLGVTGGHLGSTSRCS